MFCFKAIAYYTQLQLNCYNKLKMIVILTDKETVFMQ